MDNDQSPPPGRSKTTTRLTWAVIVAFVIAALITAVFTFVAVRDFVTVWDLTSLPGIAIAQATSTPDAEGIIRNPQNPLQPAGGPTPEPWDGASRVTVLVLGLDYRDWAAGEGAPRTDTMLLFTIDPLERTAGMLSVPRDLWVNIPGFEYGRINTAYSLGEAYQIPGGGPGLAMETVEELLGVPIDYYAQIDFSAFIRFIDEISGIKIDIKEKIAVDPLGDNNNKTLKPGVQTLSGELALAYARARKTEGGDFDRAQRQQQVVMGIRDRVLSVNMLPTLISKAPILYQELSAGINTNLNLEQAIQLAWLASQIPEESITRGVIGPPEQVLLVKSPDGDDVLKPIADKIRALRDEIFFSSEIVYSPTANMPLEELVAAEAAKISVLNGTSTPGLAALTTEYLQGQNISVIETGNGDQLYPNTSLYDYTGKPYTMKYLVEKMNISENRIFSRYDPTSNIDLVIIVGTDWAATNPMQ